MSTLLSLKCEKSNNPEWEIKNLWNNYDWYQTFRNGRDTYIRNFDCYKIEQNGLENYYVIIQLLRLN